MLHNVKSDEMYELEAALFSYLIPCYLSAFIESNNGDDKGVIFFGSVLRLLLIKSSSMLDTSLRRPAKVPVRDSADLIAQMWELQNKVCVSWFHKKDAIRVQIVKFA